MMKTGDNRKKILLAQLNSNGDCLYATVIARQIKEKDFPGCHLTWVVNSRSRQSLQNNPYIDEIWEYPTTLAVADIKEWEAMKRIAEEKKAAGDFDHIFYTQIIGENVIRLTGEIRPSIYKNYPGKLTVPYTPILRLTDDEKNNVKKFAEFHQLDKFKNVVLVECGPESFSLSFNLKAAIEFTKDFTSSDHETCFILSSASKTGFSIPGVIDGSSLSFRENSALSHHCNFFIGCGSGISWIVTSDEAKHLPKIIIIDDHALFNTSVADDQRYCGFETQDIIEIKDGPGLLPALKECLSKALNNKFLEARDQYHSRFHRKNFLYLHRVCKSSFDQWDFISPLRSWYDATKRFGFSWNAVYHMANAYLRLPYYIPRNLWRLARRRR